MARVFGQNQPILVEPPAGKPEQPAQEKVRIPPIRIRPSRFGAVALTFAGIASLFWLVASGVFLWAWLGPQGLLQVDPVRGAVLAAGTFLPPLLFLSIAAALARSAAMGDATRALLLATDRLFAADETTANNAARLARFVRRELDGLNTGLDAAYQRMRSLESVLEAQIATLDDAGARAQVRGDSIAARLNQESQRIESLGDSLTEAAGRAGETVAGRAAQLKATMESAEGTLKMATQQLDVQAAGFRAAITAAAEAPHEAAVELDRQAARIEDVSGTAMSRAEFVLARQEKQRIGMGELVARLKDEGDAFEAGMAHQRRSMEQAIAALNGEAQKFETVTSDAERHIEMLMVNAANRATQLTGSFAREVDKLKDTGEAAGAVLANLASALKDAGVGAQTLIGESAAQAKHDARLLVGEAMAECERLLRTAGEMNAEAGKIRIALAKATEDVEKHLVRLPALAQEEARRMRQMVASETEQMLDLSARTISTLQSRTGQKPAPPVAGTIAEPTRPAPENNEGLKGLARKLTARPRRDIGPAKNWEMKTLLAAAEQGDDSRAKSGADGNAVALAALEAALADLAIDLSQLDDSQPGNEEWKQYLTGDRGVFARRLAGAIDAAAVDRITALYRDDRNFHDAAEAYLSEFETLLERAKEGDGGGLLTSTLLSADTGKVYLTIAYALGRL